MLMKVLEVVLFCVWSYCLHFDVLLNLVFVNVYVAKKFMVGGLSQESHPVDCYYLHS